MTIKDILEELVFYHKDCVSGRTTESEEWDKLINTALSAIKSEIEKCVPVHVPLKNLLEHYNNEYCKGYLKAITQCKERISKL